MSTERDLPEDKLLPCPFCGGTGEYQTDTEEPGEFSEEWIGCTSCGATTALEVWNRRVAAAALASIRAERDAAVEALKDAMSELFEAEDKFWVAHCNWPISTKPSFASERSAQDKEFLATMSVRMKAARDRAARAIAGEQTND